MTNIGEKAFSGCKNLKTVINVSNLAIKKGSSSDGYVGYYADKVINADEQIGDFFFKTTDGINSLIYYIGNDSDLVLPENSKGENYIIEESVFSGLTGLTSVTIPESVTSIEDNAFKGCTGLTSITIPNSVTYIGGSAFEGCTGLTSITIPNSVTSIGSSAFEGCTGLTSITIPNSVTYIGSSAFNGCTGLTSITIPNSVTNIGGSAFEGCTGLTSITIPNSVTYIGSSAFNGCTGLTSITIPNSVTNIRGNAFYGCKNLKTVINFSRLTIKKGSSSDGYVGYYANRVINFGDAEYEQYGDFIFRNKENYYFYLSAYTGNEKCPSLPENFYGKKYEIDDYAFFGKSDLTDITIPDFVTSIGDYAFDGCI